MKKVSKQEKIEKKKSKSETRNRNFKLNIKPINLIVGFLISLVLIALSFIFWTINNNYLNYWGYFNSFNWSLA